MQMPQPFTPLMEVRNIERVYRIGEVSVAALRGVSFQIFPGELVAIMGASGSGKSTLMGILGCLDKPTGGQYILMGADTSQLGEPELARLRSQSIGFVFQSFNLLPRTTTFENTMLPLFYTPSAGGSQTARAARVHQILQQMGIADREQNTSGQLSGGQQQRVAIARALVNQPAVLLADEPTGNLDSKTAREIMEMIVRLNREQGVTIILVTHDSDIAGYADRCITMRDGEILSDISKTTSPPTNTAAGTRSIATTHRAILDTASSHVNTMVISVALQAITRNKMRSLLTMLGVFIGVAALIAMVAVGKGANEAVQRQIATLGTNLIVVLPGSVITSGVRSGFGSASTLTENDAKAILRDDNAVAQVAYVIRQMAQVQYRDRNWTTLVGGVTPNFLPTTNWQIESGRSITDQDENTGAPIALIGRSVYQQLFTPDENPIGAKILVRGTPVEVVGLLASKGQTPFGMDQDDLVMIPFTAAERRVLGVAAPTQSLSATWSYVPPPNPLNIPPRLTGVVNQIFVQAISPTDVQTAVDQVTATLTRQHHLKPTDVPDFAVRNLSQIATAAEGSSRIMALLLATVASISLLVGGIGIMNILLVSVTERTREIGLRMAIGARRRQVLMQFLIEAIFLSGIGGIAGIAGGILATKLISAIGKWPTDIVPSAIVGGFLFSAAVGIFFGYYPARKAASLDPIEALRYE